MLDKFFIYLTKSNDFIWSHINFSLILIVGVLLTVSSGFFQFRKLPLIIKNFLHLCKNKHQHTENEGLHPIRTFFAAIGGSLGISNTVAVCTAVQIGGPGALFWIWIGGFLGMLVKYAEVYLGIVYRVKNSSGGYDGGPMYYLKKAFRTQWIPSLAAILLCVYSVEVYMFNVMVDSWTTSWSMNRYLVLGILLAITLASASGGIRRVGKISSIILPIFLCIYIIMSLYVIGSHISFLPEIFRKIIQGAFTAQSATGAFAGSSLALTISMGMSRACYSSDIGVGYSSVIHAESSTKHPGKQASLAIVAIFLDIFIVCTLSILMVLVTSTWQAPMDSLGMIQHALASSFPWMHLVMPFFLFLLGYSTLIAYFAVGIKCAEHISPKRGKKFYYLYACVTFFTCCFFDQMHALTIMSISGALLFLLNVAGIISLRKEINFHLDDTAH